MENLNELIQNKIFYDNVEDGMYETYVHIKDGEFLGKREIPKYDSVLSDTFKLIEKLSLTHEFICVRVKNSWEISFISNRVSKAKDVNFSRAVSLAAIGTVEV